MSPMVLSARRRGRGPRGAALPAIEVHEAALAYRLARNRSPSIQEHVFSLLKRQVSYERLWALKGVSLSVARGELVVVVGPNGAGKSTLLKLIGRVLPPTQGRVLVRGLVAPMIELGAGFNAELTGLENIMLYGAILGHDLGYLRRRAAAIVEFAQLGEFMDVPLRCYSSGMLARLAFAIATEGQPDVLLVDEILAVGDEAFRHKSEERLAQVMGEGTAVVLVTHSLPMAAELADRAVWLEHGQIMTSGSPNDVIAAYRGSVECAGAQAERNVEGATA
jgi:ABC-type polysaccharide/polyol phosphate transport system ATPase subunit